MKRKNLYWLLCIFVILALMVIIYLRQTNAEIYIFSNIEECTELAAGTDGGDFAIYADPSSDKNLGGLSFLDFFAGKCICDQHTYEIFAYVFQDIAQAQAYFQKATGKSGDPLDPNFSLVSGMSSTKLTVLKGSMVYTVTMPAGDAEYVLQHLANTFSVKIG